MTHTELMALCDAYARHDMEPLRSKHRAALSDALRAVVQDAERLDWLDKTNQRGHYCGIFCGNLLTRNAIDAARKEQP